MDRKICFSGIQPSGIPTLGNYLGAIKNWVSLGREYLGVYSVVDMHAITVRQEPQAFRERVRGVYAILLAAGIDPAQSVLYIQSHVAAHAELAWILGCHAMFGELSRMTQFKEKSAKHADNVNAGLFTYPVLMAADILLYGAHVVPVGEDQKQHLELARNIALRFNNLCGDIFTVPEPYIPAVGARIMSLQDPSRKMDKSDPNPGAYISMLDGRNDIIKKCKRAVTDSDSDVRYDVQNKPGVSNLIAVYSLCTGKSIPETEGEFAGRGYGAFKEAVGEACDAVVAPVRKRAMEYIDNPAHLDKLMRDGAGRAEDLAQKTLRRVREAVGFIPKGN